MLRGVLGVQAQTTAAISGTVSDPSGAVITGAQVTVRNIETDQLRTVATSESARYFAPALSPGNYDVTATATGFERMTHSQVSLTAGRELSVDFSMHPGGVSEKVEVTGQPPLLETT